MFTQFSIKISLFVWLLLHRKTCRRSKQAWIVYLPVSFFLGTPFSFKMSCSEHVKFLASIFHWGEEIGLRKKCIKKNE